MNLYNEHKLAKLEISFVDRARHVGVIKLPVHHTQGSPPPYCSYTHSGCTLAYRHVYTEVHIDAGIIYPPHLVGGRKRHNKFNIYMDYHTI